VPTEPKIDTGRLAAFPPAAVLVPQQGPLARQTLSLQCVNGNVSLLDYFMQGLAQACCAGFDPDLTDGYLDATTRECWRVAQSIVRTRAEFVGSDKPAEQLVGGAA